MDADPLWPPATQERNLQWAASQDHGESLDYLQRPLAASLPLYTAANSPRPHCLSESRLLLHRPDIEEARVPPTVWRVETTCAGEEGGRGVWIQLGWLTTLPSPRTPHPSASLQENAGRLLKPSVAHRPPEKTLGTSRGPQGRVGRRRGKG